jgi:hypothetical protein
VWRFSPVSFASVRVHRRLVAAKRRLRIPALLGLVAAVWTALALSPVGLTTAAPPHGHRVNAAGGGETLFCDLSYYAIGDRCLQPLAFTRQAERTDVLSKPLRVYVRQARAVRRVSSVSDGSGGIWQLFLVVERGSVGPCLEADAHGSYWGGTCFDGSDLLSLRVGAQWTMGERVVVGIAPNADDSVQIVTNIGRVRSMALSRDHGFIYFCERNCGCEIGAIISRTRGRIDVRESLRDPVSKRLFWC